MGIMRNDKSIAGTVLIVLGLALLILNGFFGFKILNFEPYDSWVFIVLLVGISFEFAYFISGKNPGLLVPGGIITTIGMLFLFEVTTDWSFAEYTWPIYTFSVAVGLFQLYLFGGKQRGLLIASGIVALVSCGTMTLCLLEAISGIISIGTLIPIALIVGGAAIFFSGRNGKRMY